VVPEKVSTFVYKEMDCAQLRAERELAGARVEALSNRQRDARKRDILLNILVIPGLGAATSDKEAELAKAKGQVIAIEAELNARCQTQE